jgi:hypothetical protein
VGGLISRRLRALPHYHGGPGALFTRYTNLITSSSCSNLHTKQSSRLSSPTSEYEQSELPALTESGSKRRSRRGKRIGRTVSGSGNSNSGMTVPSGQLRQMNNGHPRNMSSIGPFDGPRSPPSNKSKKLDIVYRGTFTDETLWSDTSHVPCKFFRQGTCQAGKACPFSHATDNTTDLTPCKYFAKVAYSPLPSHTSTSSELLGNMDHFVLINLRETANLVPNVLWLIFYQTGAE